MISRMTDCSIAAGRGERGVVRPEVRFARGDVERGGDGPAVHIRGQWQAEQREHRGDDVDG
jgi:hypothetical protein